MIPYPKMRTALARAVLRLNQHPGHRLSESERAFVRDLTAKDNQETIDRYNKRREWGY
jgi:hypothetical protein